MSERVLTGIGVVPGFAEGPLGLIDLGGLAASDRPVAAGAVAEELARLDAAVERARRDLRGLRARRARLPDAAAEEVGAILETHLRMLDDSRLLRAVRARIEADRRNAEGALRHEVETLAGGFEALSDPYMRARAEDVREVGRRLMRHLRGEGASPFHGLDEGVLLAAESFSPAEVAQMAPARIAGFASEMGGAQGHTAILARSLGIPAVLGVPDLLETVRAARAELGLGAGEAVPALIDGVDGRVILDPTADTRRRHGERRADVQRARRDLARLRDLPARTRDATPIALEANLDLPMEVGQAIDAGAEAIGLFRTEFLFMNVDRPPDEDEQAEVLTAVVRAMGGRPVTVRTMDVGGEKLARALGPELEGAPNPALGLRAIRLSLKRPKLLEAQLCAILRAGAEGPVRILLPMITTPGEVRQVRDCLMRMRRRLARRGVAQAPELPPVGVMIEVPGAALAADALARVSDFFAIGTNDLVMYTLAIDRADEQVAALYNPLHPAVLRLMEFAIQAAERAGLPVSVCGEIAGDPRYTALLLGLGVRQLSMTAASIPPIKQKIRSIDLASATRRARAALDHPDSGRIATMLDDLNG
ncbi:phosphoenolpyruvate--protein phosphotransferase [Marivibrio halodurans]|uniref:Phosphoenolpyruvate-protein phosphotransferase n=1 Tax=Marivibrio halodurans TaxID=2039722 RepID=A0A8J7S2B0_9PROT|nr:phosphoenolpyruvate--protein phosphotransferase [Marivibrio halodurans]MBP5859052.1 phosphoenolpyruvate--protein phosphotransferase [Marivibrio halodurans]